MEKLSSTKEYLKSIDSIEKERIISYVDKYFDWFNNECSDQYDELYWLIDMAINPTKDSRENVIEVLRDTYKRMNEK